MVQPLECPHCHKPAIPVWRKLFLGPATAATCSACGGAVSVPWSGFWVIVPFLVAIVAAGFVSSTLIAAAFWIAGGVVMSWLHYRYVPLIAK
jgi:hypothetical protein